MFILLNRLTSVLMPFQQDLIWKYLLPVAIALIFLLPLPFTWHIFGLEMFASVNVKSGTFTIDYKHYPGGISNSTYAARSSSAFLIVYYDVFKLGISASNIFLTNLFYASFYQLPWLNDLTTLAIPAWLMLWASSSIRQLILKKISIFAFKIGFYKLSARLVSKESSTEVASTGGGVSREIVGSVYFLHMKNGNGMATTLEKILSARFGWMLDVLDSRFDPIYIIAACFDPNTVHLVSKRDLSLRSVLSNHW
uniref:Serpentine receptor class gamma n=1 Tax=Ditylenchus dipsaci TaxID=166011 RepID=A0A915EUT3_9BILA